MELSQVETVAEEGGIAVFGSIDAGCPVDFRIGGASCAHFPGLVASIPGFGVRDPAVDDVGATIAPDTDDDWFALEACRWRAAQGTVFFGYVVKTTLDVFTHVFEEAGIHPVDGGFEKAPIDAIRDDIFHAVDGVAATAEVGFVELGVIDITTETGVAPEDQARRLRNRRSGSRTSFREMLIALRWRNRAWLHRRRSL